MTCTTRVSRATDAEIAAKTAEIRRVFEIAQPGRDNISMPVTAESLRWSARVAVGLDRLAADFDLTGLTYYYRGLDGNPNEELGAGVIVGNSLLTARGIPASGEGDLKTCVAMLMMDRLGAGGSYTEFYAMDFVEDFILMGHDGPGHIAISDGKPVLRGLGVYHGKRGHGVSVEFNVVTGPITILGLTQTAEGRLKLLAAEGESIPGPRLADRQHQLAAQVRPRPRRIHEPLVGRRPHPPLRAGRGASTGQNPQARAADGDRAGGGGVSQAGFPTPTGCRL